jgi:hypothetical protein
MSTRVSGRLHHLVRPAIDVVALAADVVHHLGAEQKSSILRNGEHLPEVDDVNSSSRAIDSKLLDNREVERMLMSQYINANPELTSVRSSQRFHPREKNNYKISKTHTSRHSKDMGHK